MPMGALNVPASLLTVGICVLVANSLVLVVTQRLRAIKRATYLFLALLTVTDLLFGAIIVTKSLLLLTNSLNKAWCLAILSLSLGLLGSSSTAIMLLYLELFLSIKFMTLFRSPLSTRQAAYMLLVSSATWCTVAALGPVYQDKQEVWAFSLERCEIRYAFNPVYLCVIGCVYLLILMLNMCFQVGIIAIVRKRHQEIYDSHRPVVLPREMFTTEISTISGGSIDQESWDKQRTQDSDLSRKESFKQHWLRSKVSMTKLITTVLVIFTLCWYPSVITNVVYIALGRGEAIPSAVFNNLWLTIPIHAVANIFIYTAKSKEFRKALVELLCCGGCFCKLKQNKVSVLPKPEDRPTENTSPL